MTGQHRTLGLKVLAGDLHTEPLKAGEPGQVRASQDSGRHVEVFRYGKCEELPSSEDLPPTQTQHASPTYTLY